MYNEPTRCLVVVIFYRVILIGNDILTYKDIQIPCQCYNVWDVRQSKLISESTMQYCVHNTNWPLSSQLIKLFLDKKNIICTLYNMIVYYIMIAQFTLILIAIRPCPEA